MFNGNSDIGVGSATVYFNPRAKNAIARVKADDHCRK